MKRITIKIGTKVLTDKENRINKRVIKNLVDQIAVLMDKKIEVIVVTSGAIGAGLGMLSLKKKGKSLSQLQAIAAIGQNSLMDIYNLYLKKKGYFAGQILLTQEDFNNRRRFLNIRYTLNELLKYKVVPIVNENDSVSTEEIKCGDNDRLSSLVADLSNSDMLIVLTDVDGVYDENGRVIKDGQDLKDKKKTFIAGKGSEESTGGMITKLDAMNNACIAGIESVIAHGKKKDVILNIAAGKSVGTKFCAQQRSLKARKRWIAFSIKAKGKVVVDKGAEKALISKGKSLLPSGIKTVKGVFNDGDVVEVINESSKVIARGLSNYSSLEINKIKGRKTEEIEKELGYKDYDEIIHRDNLVVLEEE